MAGYQGGADATVIQAAKSAYAIPEGYHASVWDYKEFVEGVANVAKFVVGKIGAANERMSTIAGIEEGINKEFWSTNNTDYFQDGNVQMKEWSRIMSTSLPFTKAYKDAKRNYDNKMISYQKIKEDEIRLEEIIKTINSATGPEQSAFNNPMLKSLMAEIQGGTGMFDNSVRFTDEGIVVMGPEGEEILLEDLPGITLKTDGKATHDLVNTQITNAVTLKSQGNWSDRNKYLTRQNISGHLDTIKRNGLGSAAFDYEHYTANGYMSFADHLMETSGAYNEAFNEWKSGDGIGASEADIRETKMSLAQQLWDDDQSMKDEYLDFVMNDVLEFQIGEQRVVTKNKNKNQNLAEDDRGDSGDEGTEWGKNAISKINKLSTRGAQTWGDVSGTTGRGTKEEGKLLLNYDGSRGDVIKKLNSEYSNIGFSFSRDARVTGLITGDALDIKFTNPQTGVTHTYSQYLQDNDLGTGLQEYDNWKNKHDLETTNEIIKWMTMMINDVGVEADITYK